MSETLIIITGVVVLIVFLTVIAIVNKRLDKQFKETAAMLEESEQYRRNRVGYTCVSKTCPLTHVRGYYNCDKAKGIVNCTGFKEAK